METVKFRTNIGCADCLKIVSILLDADPQVMDWYVDMKHPEKMLTKGWVVNSDMLVYNLRFAGFQAARMEES